MTPIHHAKDLLQLSGERLVRASYMSLLGREPDAAGLAHYSMRLQQGYGRARVLAEIANSEEARIKGIELPGLTDLVREHEATRSWWRRLIALPGRHERSLNRVEEQLDALRQNALQSERRLDMRMAKLEAAVQALKSANPAVSGGDEIAPVAVDAEHARPSLDQGQRGQLWFKRIQSIQGRS